MAGQKPSWEGFSKKFIEPAIDRMADRLWNNAQEEGLSLEEYSRLFNPASESGQARIQSLIAKERQP